MTELEVKKWAADAAVVLVRDEARKLNRAHIEPLRATLQRQGERASTLDRDELQRYETLQATLNESAEKLVAEAAKLAKKIAKEELATVSD
ncbi:hypothetical protein [Lacipirellula limnantheis]|uniref:Uncharacterized protein n=1 Tax=Lacipirellula limnantheis TaxID=2528024 RepID=A0A517U1C4_9BACT|nr:hypothetical protein [Lacipirellula limnantheis]QDT74428.1 hypothetical protein I41_36240 [Lacipirellula limnantheis]